MGAEMNLPALYSDVQVALKNSPFKMVQDGLEINTDRPIALSTYQEVLETLLALNSALGNGMSSIQLAMGDELNAAEAEHGEDFAQIIPERAPTTLQTYKFVANSVKLPRRRGLSISVLREIAYGDLTYDDQERYLETAAAEEMTVREVRLMIGEDK